MLKLFHCLSNLYIIFDMQSIFTLFLVKMSAENPISQKNEGANGICRFFCQMRNRLMSRNKSSLIRLLR